MRESRDETADGVIGGREVDGEEESSGFERVAAGEGLSDARMDCCEGSRREVSI